MRRIRSRDTSPELVVRRLVFGLGFRYRLHVHKLPGRPDMVFARARKIIQIHGCFWHQHKGCIDGHVPKTRKEYWRPKLAGNARRDRLNEKALTAEGWKILTLWECEVGKPVRLRRRVTTFLKYAR